MLHRSVVRNATLLSLLTLTTGTVSGFHSCAYNAGGNIPKNTVLPSVSGIHSSASTAHENLPKNSALSQEELKKMVGYRAVDDFVQSGMIVGLGTGSTAYYAVERIGQKLATGELKNIRCIPTSEKTRQQAESLHIPLITLNEESHLDVAIDGADDVDTRGSLIKGGGGALLREKMVEVNADKFICIVDESKLSTELGPKFPLPVEITPFCYQHTIRKIESLPSLKGCKAVLRRGNISNNKNDGDSIAITDNGNYIVDLHLNTPMSDVEQVSKDLYSVVGVVEHGLFINMTTAIIVATKEGVRVVGRVNGGERPWWGSNSSSRPFWR